MLTLFTISGLVILLFAILRYVEIQMARRTFVSKLTSSTDSFFKFVVFRVQQTAHKTYVSILHMFSHHVPAHSEKVWDSVRRFAQAKQMRARDVLRGRKVINKENGSVSFFLKNISEARRREGSGGSIVG